MNRVAFAIRQWKEAVTERQSHSLIARPRRTGRGGTATSSRERLKTPRRSVGWPDALRCNSMGPANRGSPSHNHARGLRPGKPPDCDNRGDDGLRPRDPDRRSLVHAPVRPAARELGAAWACLRSGLSRRMEARGRVRARCTPPPRSQQRRPSSAALVSGLGSSWWRSSSASSWEARELPCRRGAWPRPSPPLSNLSRLRCPLPMAEPAAAWPPADSLPTPRFPPRPPSLRPRSEHPTAEEVRAELATFTER